MKVEFRNTTDGSGSEEDPPAPASKKTVVAVPEADPELRNRRSITELETEIKKVERLRASAVQLDIVGGDLRWLAVLKRRLRRVDPDNPWAYDD
jgi:hypothetical protein